MLLSNLFCTTLCVKYHEIQVWATVTAHNVEPLSDQSTRAATMRWSWKWLMFCSTPLPAVIGIVLPGNSLRPVIDCFGSMANLGWPFLLLFSRVSAQMGFPASINDCKNNFKGISAFPESSEKHPYFQEQYCGCYKVVSQDKQKTPALINL